MAKINPKITIRSVYFGMLLLSAAVMILTVRLTVASELVDSLKAVAEHGDATAQFNLGYMYDTGEGVPQNYTECDGIAWPPRGFATAQMGLMYRTGRGAPQNDTEAGDCFAPPSRELPRHSSIWVTCMTMVAAFPKTIPKQCDGIAWPPSRDLPRRRAVWVSCMTMVAVFPKTRGSAMVSHGRRAGDATAQFNLPCMTQAFKTIPRQWVPHGHVIWVPCMKRRRRSPKRYRGSAMVSHGRRAGICQAQVNLHV